MTIKKIVIFCILGGFFVFGTLAAQATETVPTLTLKFFDNKSQLVSEKDIFDQGFAGVTDLSAVDLGGDGINELVVSYGFNDFPEVKILRLDGSLVNSWHPYARGFEGQVNVVGGDVDGDGKVEIITAPGEGGGPHIRVFDGYGNVETGFMATEQTYRSGVEVALGDVTGDGKKDIICSLIEAGKYSVKFFDNTGRTVLPAITIDDGEVLSPLKVTAFDLTGDGKAEIVVGSGLGNLPQVYVYDQSGALLSKFLAYGENFRGGVDMAVMRMAEENVIVTSPGFGGGPHVRFFNWKGEAREPGKFFVYPEGFRGGINLVTGNFGGGATLAVIPATFMQDISLTKFVKFIKVNLTEQKLYAYDRGHLVKSFLISSGKRGFETPVGTFSVFRKRELVRMTWFYGPNDPNNYDLPNVPYTMSFKGAYTLHGAYWHSNWGHPMSHGCINISVPLSRWLYYWTPLNTPVIIER